MKPQRVLTKLIFFIKDEKGFVWGVAPTMVQARRQIAWFLPKGLEYSIEPQVIPSDKKVKS